jgi:hypothetical protein
MDLRVDYRVFVIVVAVSLSGAGCSWMKQPPVGQRVVMPGQTGSNLRRHVILPTEETFSRKPSDHKRAAKKEKTKKETAKKRNSAQTSPTPQPSKRKPRTQAEEETVTAPDRLR